MLQGSGRYCLRPNAPLTVSLGRPGAGDRRIETPSLPYQNFSIESLDAPFRPARIVSCADFEPPAPAKSRRAPWQGTRFGFVGSAEGFDLLRFEASTLALNPRIAPAVLAAGGIDALVVESAADDLGGEWGLSFLDWAGATAPARELMRKAAEAGVPRIALLRSDSGQAALFAPLAVEADHAFVTTVAAREALHRQGINAELIAPAMQPALYHGFAPQEAGAAKLPRIMSLDLVRAVDDPDTAALLDSLTPFGLGLCSADRVVRRHHVQTLPQALVGGCLGTVTADQLRHLFAASDLLVQLAWPDRDPGPDVQHALHAAASRCAVVIMGDVAEDDPRRGFARIVPNPRTLRLFISRFQMDPVAAEMQMQAAWRKAHQSHAADALALRLARCVDPEAAGSAAPRATVVTPTFRPERLQQVLDTFRAQTWANRELIVVANTDDPALWNRTLICPENDEQIIFLPRRFGPGSALNIGGARSSGDYVMRMDDDDRYGAHYVEDMMLGAAALRPDMMGKRACFYYYVDDDRLVYLPGMLLRPEFYPSARIGKGGHIAGFSHTVRRTVLMQLGGFPDGQHGGVDVGMLDTLEDVSDLLCARADSMNAVVERRSDVHSHTWHTALTSDDSRYLDLRITLEELLGDAEPPDEGVSPT